MKKIYAICFCLMAGSTLAQVPTNFGSNAEDGIVYQNYNLIDHGAVSSTRFQAQNSIAAGDAIWEFYTGDYMINWRPYLAHDTLSAFNTLIDPAIETASARYNSNYGGQSGRLPAIQAGYYYTCIIQDGGGDNLMSIVETDFAPVAIDTVYVTPQEPTVADDITITVELDGAMMLSPGEHVFIRAAASSDFTVGPTFLEIVNFANGVGTITIPAGTVPPGITTHFYALVTSESNPQHQTIDYFTLFFGNNNGNNYQVTVSAVTGIQESGNEPEVVIGDGFISISNLDSYESVQVVGLDGRIMKTASVNGVPTFNLGTTDLSSGVYVLELIGKTSRSSKKISIR